MKIFDIFFKKRQKKIQNIKKSKNNSPSLTTGNPGTLNSVQPLGGTNNKTFKQKIKHHCQANLYLLKFRWGSTLAQLPGYSSVHKIKIREHKG